VFDKLVIAAVVPLGTSLLLLLLAAALMLPPGRGPRRVRAAGWLLGLALGWLWLWSTPVASDALRAAIESRAGPRLVEQIPASDVIVVLGGSIGVARPPQRPYPELFDASDRLWHAARLYRAGKAPRVLVSGGTGRADLPPEAPAMRDFLVELGVPAAAILVEAESVNTRGNARLSARMIAATGAKRVILVTSALHMSRARAAFEREGVAVLPAPTDFGAVDGSDAALPFAPDAAALEGSGRAIKELIGRLAGR
jgi:uncharacterized SAM-binding protein YcdF (DUF218 family)